MLRATFTRNLLLGLDGDPRS